MPKQAMPWKALPPVRKLAQRAGHSSATEVQLNKTQRIASACPRQDAKLGQCWRGVFSFILFWS